MAKMNIVLLVAALFAVVQADQLTQTNPLTEAQQKASLDALNAGVLETGADPLEIIRLGLAHFKARQQSNAAPGPFDDSEFDDEDDDFGLGSLFDDEQQHQQRNKEVNVGSDEDDEDFGLAGLFNETSRPSLLPRAQPVFQRNRTSSIDDEDDFGLGELFAEKSPKKNTTGELNPVDKEADFGLNKLFSEDTPEKNATGADPLDNESDLALGGLFAEDEDRNSTIKEDKENPTDKESDFGLDSLFTETSAETSGRKQAAPLDSTQTHSSPAADIEPSSPINLAPHSTSPTTPTPPTGVTELPNLVPQTAPQWEREGNPVHVTEREESHGDPDSDQDSDFFEMEEPQQVQEPDGESLRLPTIEQANPVNSTPKGLPLPEVRPSVAAFGASKPLGGLDSGKPKEQKFVDSYIDRSDPSNPQKVHIERRTTSHVDPTGAINHAHAETRTSSSLGGDNNSNGHYSKHSSHSSYSSSSFSSSSSNPPPTPSSNNGQRPRPQAQKKGFNMNKRRSNKQRNNNKNKSAPMMSIPPLPPVVLMPVVPYGAQPAWPGFYNPAAAGGKTVSKKQIKRQRQQFASAFASAGPTAAAFAGAPGFPGAAAFSGAAGFPGAAAFAGNPAMAAAAPYYGGADYKQFAKQARRHAKDARRKVSKARHQAEHQMAAMKQQQQQLY